MPGPRLYSMFDQTMWESIANGRMRIQRCGDCAAYRYPPAACCAKCLSTKFSWEPISGKAKALSWITYHRQYLPAYPVPTTIVAAMLEEGEILIASMDTSMVGQLKLDCPVRVVYGEHPDGYKIPRFEPDTRSPTS
ncbi:hypothetical protein GCM10023144_36760 [Pigmentiphaga soli]|uniref:ChsH2 rubredoxin-like zinc ribbon domain-containing protein n=1 Tax=Pigmentiphaga soli TaxID=1007095 RepID=A0ABP8HHJ3_9BURK